MFGVTQGIGVFVCDKYTPVSEESVQLFAKIGITADFITSIALAVLLNLYSNKLSQSMNTFLNIALCGELGGAIGGLVGYLKPECCNCS